MQTSAPQLSLRPIGVTIVIGVNGSGKTRAITQLAMQEPVRSKFLGADAPRQAVTGQVKMWLKQAQLQEDPFVMDLLVARNWPADEHGNPLAIIQPAQLSAGQLRLLWMVLAVAVGVGDQGLVLIDEAEQSLHVSFQRRLVWDLERLAQRRGIQVVLSTHAPAIIDDAWEWVCSLDGEAREVRQADGW